MENGLRPDNLFQINVSPTSLTETDFPDSFRMFTYERKITSNESEQCQQINFLTKNMIRLY